VDRTRVALAGASRLVVEAFAAAVGTEVRVESLGAVFPPEGGEGERCRADVVLVIADEDLAESLRLTRRLREELPGALLLAVGGEAAEETVVAFVEAGASGYHHGDEPVAALLRTVADVQAGRPPCPPRVAAALFARLRELAGGRAGRPATPPAALSARERTVAALLAEGLRNKEIARRLGLRLATVKNHVHNVLKKLGARNRREATGPAGPALASGPGPTPPWARG
jgi:DNA-binding NarL/FixJ family response regulator